MYGISASFYPCSKKTGDFVSFNIWALSNLAETKDPSNHPIIALAASYKDLKGHISNSKQGDL